MKTLCTLLLLMMAVTFSSCIDSKQKELKNAVETVNSELPYQLDDLSSLAACEYDADRNTALFVYLINENNLDIAAVRSIGNSNKMFMSCYLKNSICEPLLKVIIDADASLEMQFIGASSHDEAIFTLTTQELKDIETSEFDAINQIETIATALNSHCPIDNGEGLVMIRVAVDGNYFVYYFDYDPSVLDLSKASRSELKANMREALVADFKKEEMSYIKKLLDELELGIKYIFASVGSEGERIELVYSAEEVTSM